MPRDIEHDEQVTVFEWAKWQFKKYPGLKLMFAIPNGGARHEVVAAKLKDEGVKPGVPDIFLPVARGGFNGLFIEMKAGANKQLKIRRGTLQPHQEAYLKSLSEQGYKAVVCYGSKEAIKVLSEYMGLK